MKKVIILVGSARKGHTYRAAEAFASKLAALGDVESEIVRLSDKHIETCRGCLNCMDRGEELCPLKDDRDELIAAMLDADGVVFATPNYSFQVSGFTKVFLDRIGFAFHRPRFFGHTSTAIVVQGIYGGKKIVDYLDFVGGGLGFKTVKGECLRSLEPMTEKQAAGNDAKLDKLARRYHSELMGPALPSPSFIGLMAFRMSRSNIAVLLDDKVVDYRYFRDHGWFESDYYYPARLGPAKQLVGWAFDSIASSMARSRG